MVKIQVDKKRRKNLQELHTATHILNYSTKKILGNHIWQHGSNLKKDKGTLDITHFENLSQEDIKKIENEVNKIIFQNLKMRIKTIPREEAEEKYGFTIYQGGAVPLKELRIVEVEGIDFEACGGLHLQETKQVGIFKIISSQKIQDGLIRLTFCVKEFALNFIQEEEKTLSEISQIFKTNKNDLLNNCKNLESNFRKNLKIIDSQKNTLKNIILKSILTSKENSYEFNEELDLNFLIEIFQEVLKEKKDFELLTKKFIISTKEVKENCNKKINKESFSIYIK